MYWQDWPLLYAAGYLASSLFDPVLWTLALCGVLLARRHVSRTWIIVPGAGVLAAAGALGLTALARPTWDMNILRVAVTLGVGLAAAGFILLILRSFNKPKTS